MRRKFLMEESDEPRFNIGSKAEAFGEGLKDGANVGVKMFFWFLLFFLGAMAYLILTM